MDSPITNPTPELLSHLPNYPLDLFYESCPKDHSTFTLFPSLPSELRLKIWQYHFPLPNRAIDLNPALPGRLHPRKHYLCTCHLDHQSTDPPLTLSINRESRLETLKRYRPLFQKPWYDIWSRKAREQPISYFNPVNDRLNIQLGVFRAHGKNSLIALVLKNKHDCFAGVKLLEIRDIWCHDISFLVVPNCDSRHRSMGIIKLFPELEVVRVVLGDWVKGWGGEMLQKRIKKRVEGWKGGEQETQLVLEDWCNWFCGGDGQWMLWGTREGNECENCALSRVEGRKVPRIEVCRYKFGKEEGED